MKNLNKCSTFYKPWRNLLFVFFYCAILGCLYSCKGEEATKQSLQALSEIPDEDRFVKIELASNLNEPMELQVLPNGDVLFIERTGAIKLFDYKTNEVRLLVKLPVFHGLEDGLLGLVLDPNFLQNNYLYLYYSLSGEKAVQRVSRFYFKQGVLDLTSEKVLLEIPTQRQECCHSAGSLAFGPDRNLYISVGDNTNPHFPGYYNSIDEREGREFWDAQRTSGNTNDLRGKILRIKPESNGTYSIPDGNLFSVGTPNTRPEIYAMGLRNPYRISIDSKTGWLYWGDVGQNTIDDPARGPISYDEWNQAKGPGFFGWPYFAGNNEPYADYNFTTGEIGPFFNPLKPINDSPNNTGLRELPPAKAALIWYSYDESKKFENLGTGGKTPIAGPFYYSEFYQEQPSWVKTPRKFPDYYNGKWFIAEWLRDWINVVTLDKAGNITKIERFMPSVEFDHPINLEFGPDGALYVLEYGTSWFAQNKNARLVRIDYHSGNRPPVAKLEVSKKAGAAPLTVSFSGEESFDYDKNDSLVYEWELVGQEEQLPLGPLINYKFNEPGSYLVRLKVTDRQGLSSNQEVKIEVGNEPPKINISFLGNESFYWNQKPIIYQVNVKDKEDGTLDTGEIMPQEVLLTIDLADMGTDFTFLAQNQEKSASLYLQPGQQFIEKGDCLSCHQKKTKSIGPSWLQIANRYKNSVESFDFLTQKIIKGGSGSWGQAAMSPHPQLSEKEASQMVEYILGLGNEEEQANNNFPVHGTFMPDKDTEGSYVFRALYKDKGTKNAPSQIGQSTRILRNARIKAINADRNEGGAIRYNDSYIRFPSDNSYITFQDIDLSNIEKLKIAFSVPFYCHLSFRLDKPDGLEIGTLDLQPTKVSDDGRITSLVTYWEERTLRIEPLIGKHTLYVIASNFPVDYEGEKFLSLDSILFLQ